MAFYDPESQILFSGDLFGGLNQLGRVHLFAQESDWAGIAQFHQIYMPSREILRFSIRQIRALNPPVKIIAPQHGHVIAGDLVPLFLDQMEQLFVGYDLLALELDALHEHQYCELVGLIVDQAIAGLGEKHVALRLGATDIDDELPLYLARRGDTWSVRRAPFATSAKVFYRLTHDKGPTFNNTMRDCVLRFCCERGVPVPPIGWGMENRPVLGEGRPARV
jgi:hypothetical protein